MTPGSGISSTLSHRDRGPARHRIAPGVREQPRRFVPTFHWELLVCGVRGHSLVGVDAREVRPEDAAVVREIDGVRWHRCIRCDSWVPLIPPTSPTREYPPSRDEVVLPLRGRALRDRVVLRLIAVNRFLHFVGLALISAAILLFRANREHFRERVLRAIADLTGTSAAASTATHGLRHDVERLFSVRSDRLPLFAVIAAGYALVELVEAVGLWRTRRWAEYLTLIVTASLLPLEVYELMNHVTPLKITAIVVNTAIVVYLLWAKRLFGIRGGAAADEERRERDTGWPAIDAATPAVAGTLRPARPAQET